MHPRQKSERLLQRSLNNPNARFRKGQWKAIDALVNDRSRLLLVQRSGWGKTMVYFLASRVLRDWGYGPTLIISPLLALIRNQEIAAERIKLRAKSVTGNNREQLDDIKEELRNDKVDLLLVTPERLSDKPFYDNVLQAVNFGLVVVDEAHCISDWGHDFRPDYRRIIGLLEKLPPNLPILGTTATANDEVVQDIEKQLSGIQVQRGPLTRENLELQTIVLSSPAKRMAWLAEQIPNLEGSGIVYVLKKRDAKNVAAWLRSVGVNAQAYFGGMKDHNFDNSGEYCRHIENLFLNNKITVLVATTALGMGYDKPDVGFVIHYQAPNSVVAYYQQVGRACRGEHSKGAGVLLSGKDDYEINKHFWGNSIPSKDIVERVIDFVGDPDGVTVSDIARGLNQGEKLIQQAIKYLSAQAPSPIEEIEQYRWRRTDVDFTMDWKAIRRVNAQREGEWKQIQEYIRSKDCRMAFLRRALSDFDNRECNRCDNCTGKSPVNSEFSEELEHQASEFLKESEFEFQCPVEIPPKAVLPCYGFKDSIPDDRRPSEVRVLSHYGDAGWGGLVKRGKYEDGYFDNELVEAIAEMITDRWKPKPDPKWVTCIPSARESKLVRSFSERLAIKLRLPFIDVLVATGKSKLQKDQKHPSNKCSNLDDAFKIKNEEILPDPVLLIDDIVESGWTFTIATALLRQEGSGDVFPVALASAAKS
ncbi:MAG: RecQ family ATP-dependent DNA helicase [Bacteroidota bacterium]|nr:RecQ family ATP-dependent DNA helicase [Bacteroidota bacterium]MYJ45089.1 RecQ family ATP-dependent DNA helicase [Rhodothermaceae bacterium]